jgi:hypothetical protein
VHGKNEVSPRIRSFSTAFWLTLETGCAAEIGDDMLMGNPNLHEDDEEEGDADEDEDDKQDPIDAQAEEAEMDNVEALMAGVAIEEKDKVSPGVGYDCDFD